VTLDAAQHSGAAMQQRRHQRRRNLMGTITTKDGTEIFYKD
jgi:hypothetical protein